MTFYNSDVLSVGDDFMIVCEMYFRLAVSKVEHERVVYSFMDWLGSIGGVLEVLFYFIRFLLGWYSEINCDIELININNEFKKKEDDELNINQGSCTLSKLS